MDLLLHLQSFLAVAEELHFGRAAARLNMAQPPLSRRIRALEQHLGKALFERSSRSVELTALGRRLIPEARELLDHASLLDARFRAISTDRPLTVAVGVPASTPATALAELLRAVTTQLPHVALEVVQGTPAHLSSEVAGGRLGVAAVCPPPPEAAASRAELERPLGVLFQDDDALASIGALEPVDLSGRLLVLPPREAAPREDDRITGELGAYGLDTAAAQRAEGPTAAGRVMADRAVALCIEPAQPFDGLTWRPLAAGDLHVRLCIVVRRDASPEEGTVAASLEVALVNAASWSRTARAFGPARPRATSGLPW